MISFHLVVFIIVFKYSLRSDSVQAGFSGYLKSDYYSTLRIFFLIQGICSKLSVVSRLS